MGATSAALLLLPRTGAVVGQTLIRRLCRLKGHFTRGLLLLTTSTAALSLYSFGAKQGHA